MREKNPTLLAIEDEIAIRRFLKSTLTSQGYCYLEAETAQLGLLLAQEHKPDAVLLDLGLPDMDGMSVIKSLREWSKMPIIVLSARDRETDKVAALNAGADDYLTKPFGVAELNARINVALRHGQLINEIDTPIFHNNELKIDLIKRRVWITEREILFSPTQFSILSVLVRRANKIVTHKQLLAEVWQSSPDKDVDYLRIYIHQLRHKLEENPAHPKYLQTEPGVGYRLVCG